MTVIDLNSDLGESFGVYTYGADPEMMPMITSANIACGAHGGDPAVMRTSVDLAYAHGVAIGAHVGLPDRLGFGRREIPTTPQEAHDLCVFQVGALEAFVRVRGSVLQHVKLHGSLYMMANRDRGLAEAVCAAVNQLDPSLILYVLPESALHAAATESGLSTMIEVFADRPYRNGSVQMYDRTAELIGGPDQVIARTLAQLSALDGADARTVCLHSDTPDAPVLLAELRSALVDAGYSFRPPRPTASPPVSPSVSSPTGPSATVSSLSVSSLSASSATRETVPAAVPAAITPESAS
ncbi:5-oxoprolinase subunit PxpA [Gordonia jinghuaiqii]|uniref:5-oxoprolinase subunit PxpA n=1 Tax=Gordonia jinghuaiqii TaxID=2758710 RepID=A0A7D7LRI4_9ACTN|nr:5-oxoprolinase subunit PxpA [Gordonia jinghuaiqii]MCR5978035.1 5-oxoprolinase subunit PxpA [Gordonia jinghuaiqii]QMT01500.1 5-oxoprolinase subunit PxpA [Gordonia jinghuaiqii]